MSDLPDFTNYSQVDLVQQTIAFLTNRPMYGEATNAMLVASIEGSGDYHVINVYGKGMIYTGNIYLVTDHSIGYDEIIFKIDGNSIEHKKWMYMRDYNFTRPDDYVMWLSVYDDVNYVYSLNIKSGLTFEEHVEVIYREIQDYSFTAIGNLIYALLTT